MMIRISSSRIHLLLLLFGRIVIGIGLWELDGFGRLHLYHRLCWADKDKVSEGMGIINANNNIIIITIIIIIDDGLVTGTGRRRRSN